MIIYWRFFVKTTREYHLIIDGFSQKCKFYLQIFYQSGNIKCIFYLHIQYFKYSLLSLFQLLNNFTK